MRAAGFTVVRLGEFAWSSMEPAEGQFNFDWLERAIAQLSEAGILTVLGTPTAAPPAWLTRRTHKPWLWRRADGVSNMAIAATTALTPQSIMLPPGGLRARWLNVLVKIPM